MPDFLYLLVEGFDDVLLLLQLADVLEPFRAHLSVQLLPLLLQFLPQPLALLQLVLVELDGLVGVVGIFAFQSLDLVRFDGDDFDCAFLEDVEGFHEVDFFLLELVQLVESSLSGDHLDVCLFEAELFDLMQIFCGAQGFEGNLIFVAFILGVVEVVGGL